MGTIDSVLFVAFLIYVIYDGVRKGRRKESAEHYFLAGRASPWWTIGLSIMATQASAITMIGTTGQGMQEGMRFVQFYFGLPVAMLILAYTLVPLFNRARVFTAYEFLGQRFDRKTRLTSALIFLALRMLSLAVVIYSPAIVFALLFDISPLIPTLVLGLCATIYTTLGGLSAVIATDVKQMIVMVVGLLVAFAILIAKLPEGVSWGDAVSLADATGHMQWLDFSFDPSEKFTVPSALLGGTLLFLAYFGCDQSQVQRLLAGRSLSDTRRALFLNAIAKVPFQGLVLLCGVMLFVFYLFQPVPLTFVSSELNDPPAQIQSQLSELEARHQQSQEQLSEAALRYLATRDSSDATTEKQSYLAAVAHQAQLRTEYRQLRVGAQLEVTEERNYAFPHFILHYMPSGLLGLLLAAIVAAALSSIDSEINAISTVAVIDGYCFGFGKDPDAPQTLKIGRAVTLALGVIATLLALEMHQRQGSIIEVVNDIGSHFYGSLLGVFALVYWKGANGHGATAGLIVGTLGTWLVKSFYVEVMQILGYGYDAITWLASHMIEVSSTSSMTLPGALGGDSLGFLYLNTLGVTLTVGSAVAVSLLTTRRV